MSRPRCACRHCVSSVSTATVHLEYSRSGLRKLKAVHGCFFLAQLPLALGIVGPGEIGSTLLRQLHEQAQVCQQTSLLE